MLTTGIEISSKANLKSGEKYLLTVVVETLAEDVDINLFWKK